MDAMKKEAFPRVVYWDLVVRTLEALVEESGGVQKAFVRNFIENMELRGYAPPRGEGQ